MTDDILGQAIYDHYNKLPAGKLWIHNTYGPKEEMPVAAYFRGIENMPALEVLALQLCKGKVLDIGAGAGSHALVLQQKEIDVTALEISSKACEVMEQRGVTKIVQQDIFTFTGKRFDTLLLLMNGIGLTSTISNLEVFLRHAKKLLNTGGQLLFDSSNVAYLYEGKVPVSESYYGEILYRYEYKRQKTDWFKWLYIDKHTLAKAANKMGWEAEVLFEDEFDQYLVRLVRKT